MARYHDDSFVGFFATYYDLRMVSDETLMAFVEWVKKRRAEFRRYYPDKKSFLNVVFSRNYVFAENIITRLLYLWQTRE